MLSKKNSSIEIEKKIEEALESIRPYLLQDNGDLEYKGFKDGIVYILFHGACQTCPSSMYTLKMGIENFIKERIPEVEAVEEFSEDMETEE